jgi:hypothetical protein
MVRAAASDIDGPVIRVSTLEEFKARRYIGVWDSQQLMQFAQCPLIGGKSHLAFDIDCNLNTPQQSNRTRSRT